MRNSFNCLLIASLFMARTLHGQAGFDGASITEYRVPHGGIQPQAVSDRNGILHLLYFTGDPKGGDLNYVRLDSSTGRLGSAVRVNSKPGSAIAVGTIRGGQIALGRQGRVHVAWMGSSAAEPAVVEGGKESPMLYARLNDSGTAFEEERNLLRETGGLDGGGSVAADEAGRVWVSWHGHRPGDKRGEQGRGLFVAASSDDGKTFEVEVPAGPAKLGSCGCCGMKTAAAPNGGLFLAYRNARSAMDRDMALVWHGGDGRAWDLQPLAPWKSAACPMSASSLFVAKDRFWAAWEQEGKVQARSWGFPDGKPSALLEPNPIGAKMRHPSIAAAPDGSTLLAWTEGTGWQKGGSVAWQRFDPHGKPVGTVERRQGVPVWGTVAVAAGAQGFWVIY